MISFQRKGIYVISPDLDFTRLTAECPPRPGVSVCRLSKFENDNILFFISCLQITHDAIYFTYKPSPTSSSLDTPHHAHMPGGGFHAPLDDVFLDVADDMEDGFAAGWVDEDEELEMDEEEDDGDGWYLTLYCSPLCLRGRRSRARHHP